MVRTAAFCLMLLAIPARGVEEAAPAPKSDASTPPSGGAAGELVGARSALILDLKDDLGGVGDGVTLNDGVPGRLSSIAQAHAGRQDWRQYVHITVRVPPGRYLFSAGVTGWWQNVHLVGTDRDLCVIASASATAPLQINISHAENLTFVNVLPRGGSPAAEVRLERCRFLFDLPGTWGSTYFVNASPSPGGSVTVEDCVFEYPPIYVGLWVLGAKNVTIRNSSLSGTGRGASHDIRVDEPRPGGRIEITGNRLHGGQTGIFLGSNRMGPIEGVLIQGNVVDGIDQEGISLDGFGNNPGLAPVIANGPVRAAANDGTGRLVITPSLVYHDGKKQKVPCPLDLRKDWTSFYFTFGEGSGLEGTVAKILSFDAAAGSLTLDVFTSASRVKVGGDVGVQAGFFGPVIRDNVIHGSYGSGNKYANGISLWLNVFNALIDNNTVYGCANGIDLAGGLLMSTYYALAYNNVIRNNRFLRTSEVPIEQGKGGSIRAVSYFGGRKQYGNRFEGNLVDGGTVYLMLQGDLTWEGNDLRNGATLVLSHCGNSLPPADASQIGRRFMRITDDASGKPVEIGYFVCALSAGTYTWVPTP